MPRQPPLHRPAHRQSAVRFSAEPLRQEDLSDAGQPAPTRLLVGTPLRHLRHPTLLSRLHDGPLRRLPGGPALVLHRGGDPAEAPRSLQLLRWDILQRGVHGGELPRSRTPVEIHGAVQCARPGSGVYDNGVGKLFS